MVSGSTGLQGFQEQQAVAVHHCTDILMVFSATNETTAEKATGQMGYQQALLKETQCTSG